MSAKDWTHDEDAVLISGVRASAPNKLMARELDRTVAAVVARLSVLRLEKKLAAAKRGRRRKPADTAVTPADLWARADLAQAITTLGRLLPLGMQVLIYRPEGEDRAAIETTCPNGKRTRHWVDQAMH